MRRLGVAATATGFYGLTLAVALAMLPLGSVDATSAGLLGLLISLSLFASLASPPPNQATSWVMGVAFAVCAILVAWTLIQVGTTSPGVPFPDPATATPAPDESSLSAAPEQPFHSIGYALLPFAAFIAAASTLRDARTFTRSAHIVLGLGALVTAAALLQHTLFPGHLLLDEKRYYLGSFTGTFVNPNTAATYFGVLLVLSLALMARPWSVLAPWSILRFGRRLNQSDHEQARMLLFYVCLALVFGVALLLTKSRAGVLSSFAAIAVLAGGQAYLSLRRKRSVPVALAGSLLMIGAITAIFGFFGSRWMSRIESEGIIDEHRLCTYGATWQAIKEHFFWGTGAGTFQDVFPTYRTDACGADGYWEMAHSVPLEGWLSFGAAFLVAAALVYGALIVTYARGLKERRRYRYVPLACLAILLLVTLHSAIDFSLQIPAVALLVGWALGAGAAISLGRSSDAGPEN